MISADLGLRSFLVLHLFLPIVAVVWVPSLGFSVPCSLSLQPSRSTALQGLPFRPRTRACIAGPIMQALQEPPGKKKGFLSNLKESLYHIQDPDSFMAERAKEFGPVFSTTLFFRPTVVVGGPENVAELLEKEDAVRESSLPLPLQALMTNRNLLLMSGQRHTIQKKILNSILSKPARDAYTPIIERRVDEYLDRLIASGETYLAKDLTEFSLQLFAELFSGTRLTPEEEELFVKYNNGLFALFKFSPKFLKAKKAREILETNFQKRFDDVLAAGKLDDGIHTGWKNLYEALRLAAASGEKEMLPDDMGYTTVQMIWGAYIECASLCSHTIITMMDRPDVVKQALLESTKAGVAGRTSPSSTHTSAKYELPYILGILRETLRTIPPAGGGFRISGKPLQIAGFDIPVGTVITPDPRIGAKDPKVFPSPDSFEPLRWVSADGSAVQPTPEATSSASATPKRCPFTGTAAKLDRSAWFPGGTGHHQCPGVPLAELVATIFVAKWVSRIDKWEGVTPLEFVPPVPIKLPKDSYKVALIPKSN